MRKPRARMIAQKDRQGTMYLLDGLPFDRRMASTGWEWVKAPTGAGPGVYRTRNHFLADVAARILGIGIQEGYLV